MSNSITGGFKGAFSDVELNNIRKERMLEVMVGSDDPVLTTAEIAAGMDIGERATHNHLSDLEERGIVTRKKASRASIWWIPEEDGKSDGPPERNILRFRTGWPPVEVQSAPEKRKTHAVGAIVTGIAAVIGIARVGSVAAAGIALAAFFSGHALCNWVTFPRLYDTEGAENG